MTWIISLHALAARKFLDTRKFLSRGVAQNPAIHVLGGKNMSPDSLVVGLWCLSMRVRQVGFAIIGQATRRRKWSRFTPGKHGAALWLIRNLPS